MRFSTVFSVLACGAMALAASIAPDILLSRANADISAVISTLDKRCDAILPQFGTCKDAKCTDALVLDIVAAVDVATAACVDVKGVLSLSLAKQIADIVIKIFVKLDSHKSSCDGKCGDLSIYTKIDLCLSLMLKQLGICVSGILTLVATLLLDLVVILRGLNLNLILQVCLLI